MALEDLLTRRVERALAPSDGRVRVDLEEGRVVLSGVVRDYLASRAAVAAVRDVAGDREVENRIRVDPIQTVAAAAGP